MGMCYVPLYFSYREPLTSALTYEQLGMVVAALLAYAEEGTQPVLEGAAKMAFEFLRANYERNCEVYSDLVETSRARGRNGGAPKGNQNARKKSKPDGDAEKTIKTIKTIKTTQQEQKQEQEQKQDQEQESSSSAPAAAGRDEDDEPCAERVLAAYREVFGEPNASVAKQLRRRVRDMGEELVLAVLNASAENGARGWPYLRTALEDCRTRGITTAAPYAACRRPAGSGGGGAARGVVDRPAHSGVDILAKGRGRVPGFALTKRRDEGPQPGGEVRSLRRTGDANAGAAFAP